MNEQLIVKNFGPIKDATVDFKRVTVFIGPTGGGKSTLAKLKDIFLYGKNYLIEGDSARHPRFDSLLAYSEHSLINFFSKETILEYTSPTVGVKYTEAHHFIGTSLGRLKEVARVHSAVTIEQLSAMLEKAKQAAKLQQQGLNFSELQNQLIEETSHILHKLKGIEKREESRNDFPKIVAPIMPWYCPSERIFVSALEYSWAGLLRDDIGIPKNVLDFANKFSVSRRELSELDIPFLNVKYLHRNGQDFIQVPGVEALFRLYETASGIQSVTPLLVLLEHLSRNTEQAQSFIIEEPELNLYPTAQRDLVYWLLEKCTQGENDLTITTHSPYVLSALNLALYAGKVATLFPHQRQKVAKIIPEKYWLKADEFSAYYVAGGGAKSIFDTKTGLLSESQLDDVSVHFADVFDRLTDLRVPEKKAPAKAKSTKK